MLNGVKRLFNWIRNTDLYPTFDDFVNFVQTVSIDACDPLYDSGSSSTKPSAQLGACNSVTVGGTSTGAAAHSAPGQVASRDGRQASQNRSCVVCHQARRVFQCEIFKAMSPIDRLAVARSNGLCFNCLFPGHRIQKCKSLHSVQLLGVLENTANFCTSRPRLALTVVNRTLPLPLTRHGQPCECQFRGYKCVCLFADCSSIDKR